MKPWIEAMRFRTLPLSLAGVFVASGLAAYFGIFSWPIFIPMAVMVLILQVIANFADEYGDLQHGADTDDRVGPKRGMQRGEITAAQMKRALVIASILAAASIVWLLCMSFRNGFGSDAAVFFVLGALCIAAAITYTVGRHAYGYYALGDISAFVFFGLVAVCGGFYLYAHTLVATVWLPATGLGLLVVGMININNMRDMAEDIAAHKNTVASLLGNRGSRIYQYLLVGFGMACFLAFPIASGNVNPLRYLFVLFYIPVVRSLVPVATIEDRRDFDALMKPHSMGTALLSLAFALCMAIG